MGCSLMGRLVIGAMLTAMTTIGMTDDAQDEAIQKDRKRIEGTWRIVALEVNGNQSNDADARKLTVANGSDGTWRLLSQGKEISRETSTVDSTKQPRTIDFTPTEGNGQGNQYLGIYELCEKARKMCFAPPGKERPTVFVSASDSESILVVFERQKRN